MPFMTFFIFYDTYYCNLRVEKILKKLLTKIKKKSIITQNQICPIKCVDKEKDIIRVFREPR